MIFYLSGTGNTEWVANQLATAIGERLINIAAEVGGECHYHLADGESLGFCFPIHGWRPPILVRAFFSQLHLECNRTPYCWTVVTAGTDVGIAERYLQSDLRKIDIHTKGNHQLDELKAHFIASVIMPNTYVGLPLMDVDAVDITKQKIQDAKIRVQKLIDIIQQRKEGFDVFPGSMPWLKSKILGGAFAKWLVTDKPFRTNDQCKQCGVCAHVCPIQNIIWEKGQRPVWKHNNQCMTCFACYHHCHSHAIDFAGQTKRKGQYFFPKS